MHRIRGTHIHHYVFDTKLLFSNHLQVKKSDEFPKFICFDCTNQLKNSYNFRQLCLASLDKLKAFIVDERSDSPDFQNDLSATDPPVKLESFLSIIVDDDLAPASNAIDNSTATPSKRKYTKRKSRPKSSDSVQTDDGDNFGNQSFDEQSIKDESFVDPFDGHIQTRTVQKDDDTVKTAKKRGRKAGIKKEMSDDAAKSPKKVRGKYKKREKSERGERVPKERTMQICPICGEQRLSIENHMLTMHTDEKPCCCEICGKWIKSNHIR